MSKKKVAKKIIADIVKRVAANRDDVVIDDLFIRQVTSNTLKATPVIDILSHMEEMSQPSAHGKDDDRLAPCIEVLALINSMIDYQLSESTSN